jgi:hypothetical protein
MTYAQLRRALSEIARYGETAPTAALPMGRFVQLKGAGLVVFVGADRWRLTSLGRRVLGLRSMPTHRPRRTPSVGHAAQNHAMRRTA